MNAMSLHDRMKERKVETAEGRKVSFRMRCRKHRKYQRKGDSVWGNSGVGTDFPPHSCLLI